jgi:ubiquinone/menaquinone biosynthesis C-methylase UbiE
MNEQYGKSDLSARILSALAGAGKDLDRITLDDLSEFDQLHYGGKEATLALAKLAGLDDRMLVLDIGSGLGGPARTLAAEIGCRVVGLDITDEFVSAAEMLTDKVGLSEKVSFRQGTALNLSFEEEFFDVVWTQNAIMNIEDKKGVFQQAGRVLRPEGLLVMEAILAGPDSQIQYPVYWADRPELSFLSSPEEIRKILADLGFVELEWLEVTPWPNQEEQEGEQEPSLGIDLIFDDAQLKRENVRRGFENGHLVDIYTVQRRAN